jgi:hypothetical protein
MQGFQRVESPYTSSLDMTSIAESIMKQSSITLVGDKAGLPDNKLRFMGMLPASNDPVLVSVADGKIVVCCDHAVAVNSILGLMKRALN